MSTAKKKKKGVTIYEPSRAFDGYTLFAPLGGYNVWLINMQGKVVHHWALKRQPCFYARLLPTGNLLYQGREEKNVRGPAFDIKDSTGNVIGNLVLGGGEYLIELDSNKNTVWHYEDPLMTHDFYRMDNGNTLFVKYVEVPENLKNEIKGGLPVDAKATMWSNVLVEVNKKGEVLWEWFDYEHLDFETEVCCPLMQRWEWTHANACSVLQNGDILASFRHINLICIIDKKTGNLKWKWGPGEIAHQHNPSMLDNGNVLVFDNGEHRQFSKYSYSRVIEVNPATNKIEWEYKEDPPFAFFNGCQGGCQRLPNGNTLITDSIAGRIFEVTYECEKVWEYVSPFYGTYGGRAKNPFIHRAYRYGPDYSGLKGKDLDSKRYKWINEIYGPAVLAITK